ncbi:MAG: bi-domain-containing oxidoreductase [Candidatus Omnitrophota bacterium]|nr:bi-domain-containing oxidoreductase [Candidatus Omnitrophota bacterium]
MKQIVQNYKTGKLNIEEVPPAVVKRNGVQIKTRNSLISAGTERTKVETAQMNIIEKAVSRLDLMKTVLNNIKQEGIIFTFKKAFNKLDSFMSLGYSCSGEVIAIGEDSEFKVGDRVACVGENYAAHSEINSAPRDFVINIPENVSYQDASFVGLGAIALNAVKLAQLRQGELVAVIGLGLIGQIIIQIIKTEGCRVFGIDIDNDKLILGSRLGMDSKANPLSDDIYGQISDFTSGEGVDAVIVSAASNNNLPIEMAGKIARNKGRVILVGAMPIIIPRKDYYEKELYFTISCGFGSGLYYQDNVNRAYPYNYKSHSVKENMRDFISFIARKKVDVTPLVTHRFHLREAADAYELIRTRKEKHLGIIFDYNGNPSREKNVDVAGKKDNSMLGLGFIGGGSFAQGYILPVLKKMKEVNLVGISTATGINAKNIARKFGFRYCTTEYNRILNDKKINCVFIATRHDLHAKFVIEALKKGKNVFVEKPLCLNERELKEIVSVYQLLRTKHQTLNLMVGFNRRFSPFVKEIKTFFRNRTAPLIISYRVNAGYLPARHWVHTSEGGGRIIGEVCHFVDLLTYFTESFPVKVSVSGLKHPDKSIPQEDNVIINLEFRDGSLGSINYNAIGDISFPRERVEIFGNSSVAIIDNFKTASLSRNRQTKVLRKLDRDMGHRDEIETFVKALLTEKRSLISFNEIVSTTVTTFKIQEALKSRGEIAINMKEWGIHG